MNQSYILYGRCQSNSIMNLSNSKLPLDLFIRMSVIRDLGFHLSEESVILDFGCGSGKKVRVLRDLGYQAFGCGTRFNTDNDVDTKSMMHDGIVREINLNKYILPFEDNSFDFIFSESVFEHVGNYSESISELARVLKPDGVCLHTFVSRFKPIEVHVKIPFASYIQSYGWLYFWVSMGCRNEWTDCQTVKDRTKGYLNYLKEETNYLGRRDLLNHFQSGFKSVAFCERLYLKYSPGRRRYLFSLAKIFPFIPGIFSTFNQRVIATSMPIKATNI